MTVESIIEEIKNGKCMTIACSQYEEATIYKRGMFKVFVEDGLYEGPPIIRSEAQIRRDIEIALNNPDIYDIDVE